MEETLARLHADQQRNEQTVAQMRKQRRLLAEVEAMKKKVGTKGI